MVCNVSCRHISIRMLQKSCVLSSPSSAVTNLKLPCKGHYRFRGMSWHHNHLLPAVPAVGSPSLLPSQYLATYSLERCAQEIVILMMQNFYLPKLPQDVCPPHLPSLSVQSLDKFVHQVVQLFHSPSTVAKRADC